MALKIGTATAMLTPETAEFTPDNRRQLVKTMTLSGGVLTPSVSIRDGGYCASGLVAKYAGTKWDNENWALVEALAAGLAACTVVEPDGSTTESCHIFISRYVKNKHFPGYVEADLEIWRV